VVSVQLQQRGREHPHGRASEVRKGCPQTSEPDVSRLADERISNRRYQVAEEDTETQALVAMSCPTRANQRTQERSQTARAQQQAHAQHRAALRIEMVPANRKVPLSHDREQNPARTDDEVPSLHEDGGEQTALAAHV